MKRYRLQVVRKEDGEMIDEAAMSLEGNELDAMIRCLNYWAVSDRLMVSIVDDIPNLWPSDLVDPQIAGGP